MYCKCGGRAVQAQLNSYLLASNAISGVLLENMITNFDFSEVGIYWPVLNRDALHYLTLLIDKEAISFMAFLYTSVHSHNYIISSNNRF